MYVNLFCSNVFTSTFRRAFIPQHPPTRIHNGRFTRHGEQVEDPLGPVLHVLLVPFPQLLPRRPRQYARHVFYERRIRFGVPKNSGDDENRTQSVRS